MGKVLPARVDKRHVKRGVCNIGNPELVARLALLPLAVMSLKNRTARAALGVIVMNKSLLVCAALSAILHASAGSASYLQDRHGSASIRSIEPPMQPSPNTAVGTPAPARLVFDKPFQSAQIFGSAPTPPTLAEAVSEAGRPAPSLPASVDFALLVSGVAAAHLLGKKLGPRPRPSRIN